MALLTEDVEGLGRADIAAGREWSEMLHNYGDLPCIHGSPLGGRNHEYDAS
jgi:hypothetical protein